MEKLRGPVVIGGIGGSGTRVVAEMLAMMGFFLGNDLNPASDNLSYTLLFKRPEWFRKNAHHTRKIFRGLSILEKSLVTGSPLNLPEKLFLRKAVRDMSIHGHNKEGEGKGEWAYDRLAAIKKPRMPDLTKYAGWGWKEPNSHLMISMMKEYFQGYKYIHTIRHGLDMAFSTNQQQLYNWASLFDVALPGNDADIPRASLKYWIKANKNVYSLAERYGEETILIIDFDDLCRNPMKWIEKISAFLRISPDEEMIAKLAKLPNVPGSTGRYRQFPKNSFDPQDIEEVSKLGFDCTY